MKIRALLVVVPDATATGQTTTHDFSVLLDIKTEPESATIYFNDQRFCQTPCKQSVSVQSNQTYTLYADFELREINDIYRKKVEFKVRPDANVIEIAIDAEIGMLKVIKLPRRSEFSLEGFYEYDKMKANPAKISNVIYGRPIFLPYGTYLIELREKTKVAGSETEITEIRFQREYKLDKNNKSIELAVTDLDLQFFPATIDSVPPNAEVYYGDEKVGTTPFAGKLPIGTGKLKINKEGFFPTIIDIDMRMNSLYQTTVHLKTSKIGELLNDAKESLRNEQPDNAINTLMEALKFGGSPREKAEVYFLLGNTFLNQKKAVDAKPYFERAKEFPEFESLAKLGLARVALDQKDTVTALMTTVEVLANLNASTPDIVRAEANNVFKLISPVKSVMYIFSEPAGAKVFVNDKLLGQVTPLILSDLALGNYRLQIEKPGYETYKTQQNIKLGEFLLVRVKLNQGQQ